MREELAESDVLVIGGGAAGCLAALAAQGEGARVLIAEKGGAVERSGNLASGIDHYQAILGEAPWDNPETFLETIAETSDRLDLKVLRAYAREAKGVFHFVEGLGVPFKDPRSGRYRRVAGLGDRYPTWVNFHGGRMKPILAQAVHKAGVQVVERVAVQELLTQGDRVVGALGFHVRSGQPWVFRAKAVVISTGGVVRLYPPPSGRSFMSHHCPFNTGDGHAMAFRAGAALTNMEFPSCSIVPAGFSAPGITGFIGLGAHLINARGERYMERYHPWLENAPRGITVTATLREYQEGRGPCFVDLRPLSPQALGLVVEGIENEKPTLLDYFKARGLDLRRDPIPYEVQEFDILGSGMAIDEATATTLPGLFSAGDCTHISLGAATGCTMGFIAGRQAARFATGVKPSSPNPRQVARYKERFLSPLEGKGALSPGELEEEARGVMARFVGFTRDGPGLEQALRDLQALKERWPEVRAENPHELLRANEAYNLIETGAVVARAAGERKESRGGVAHSRSDYPQKDEGWSRFILLSRGKEGVMASFKPMRGEPQG